MTVEFFKKGTVQRTAFPSPTYPDLYDNNVTTTDISSGTFDTDGDGITDKNKTQMLIADLLIPNRPSYGSAELKGLEVGLYINSIIVGDNQTIPGLKAYRLDTKIGNNEGGKGSAGSLITTEFSQFSSHHSKTSSNLGTDFSTASNGSVGKIINSGAVKTYVTGAYIPRRWGYKYGKRFGQEDGNALSQTEHFERYGATVEGVELYRIYTGLYSEHYLTERMGNMYFSKEYERWGGYNYEYWEPEDVDEHIQYSVNVPLSSNSKRIGSVEELNEGFFDIISTDTEFQDMGSDPDNPLLEPRDIGYARISTSQALAATGGKSMHMNSLYTHRHNTKTNIFYPKRNNVDGSELQQISFASKELPIPTHLYTREPVTGGDGRQPVMPEIEFDINFEDLPHMLIRNQLTLGLPSHDNRLNRSFVITFGEERPVKGQNLYNYLKAHTPNATAAGTGAGTGLGTGSVKSLYGLAFVNFGGMIGVYELGSAGKSSTTYTDVTYRLDDSRGEVAFSTSPSFTNVDEGLESSWFKLTMQQHPNDSGMYYTLTNTKTGRVMAFGNSQKVENVKNTTGSGTVGLWEENMNVWPRHMTVWNNNYQGVLSEYDTTAKKYKTGLQVADTLSTNTSLWVYSYNFGANPQSCSYLLLDSGSQITSTTGDMGHVSENPNTGSVTSASGAGAIELTLAANKSASANDYIYYTAGKEEDWLIEPFTDVRSSVFIDSIKIKNYNLSVENATPMVDNMSVGRLRIPQTVKLHNTGFTSGSSFSNIEENVTQQPSYLCFGFDSLSDITTTNLAGEIKHILLNDYSVGNTIETGTIVTNTDSDVSNIRVGFTSSVENYGRQGAADSTRGSAAAVHPDIGNGESGCFGNNEGNPDYTFRGLRVGDLDTAENDFSVESNGSGSDGVGNVDYFTQKGLMKFRVPLIDTRIFDSTATVNNGGVISAIASSFDVSDGTKIIKNGYIKIESEVMKVTDITSNTITVDRGIEGTDNVEHPDSEAINLIALPEKRECIFASARVISQSNSLGLSVDNIGIFQNHQNTEFILYKYNDSHAAPTSGYPKTLTLREIDNANGVIKFNESFTLDNPGDYLISQKKFWLMVEVMNIGGAHGYQDDTVNTVYLPEKSYLNGVGISEKGTYGVTWNEFKYNDGANLNKWNLDTQNILEDSGNIVLDDYGFGAYDKEKQTGGHAGIQQFNTITDISNYNDIKFDKVLEKGKFNPGDTVPMMFTPLTPTDNVKINIDTEDGTSPIYVKGRFEDKLPIIKDFGIKPNKENPYNVDFNWSCTDSDLWYGFLIVGNSNVNNQYHGAILHYPMNEEGKDGAKATVPVDQIQGMTTAVDAASSTGPFYDIEGLAGNCLRFDDTGTPAIEIGTGSADPLQTTGYIVTDEMTINIHVKHDADVDGTLADTEYILMSTQRLWIKIETDGTVTYRQYWDTNSYVELKSAGKIATDGDTPTNIMITFDANLTSGNLKLFLDGRLEDQSGEVIIADSGTANTGWLYGANIESNNNKIFVGNHSDTGSKEFLGSIEELVIYNKCLYPVDVKSGEYTFTKPLSELADSSSYTTSKSYTGRLFIKDYHNVRGSTSDEVACSSPQSFRKSAFRLDNS